MGVKYTTTYTGVTDTDPVIIDGVTVFDSSNPLSSDIVGTNEKPFDITVFQFGDNTNVHFSAPAYVQANQITTAVMQTMANAIAGILVDADAQDSSASSPTLLASKLRRIVIRLDMAS